tara:strand:- start:947 stop:1777 length:831 start_codon:yes stop_codon:yes gene_type:complete
MMTQEDPMECLLRLFAADEGIAERVHSRTIVISTWQKFHPALPCLNTLLGGPHLAEYRKKLEVCDMSTTTPNGATVLVRPSEYAFVSSMACTERLGYRHIIYDATYEAEIFQNAMDLNPKRRPKLKHLEFIEVPDPIPFPDINTDRNISVYDKCHNARCIRGGGYSESRSFTKYHEYLQRCQFFEDASFGLEAMRMVAKAQKQLHREKSLLHAQEQMQPKLFLEDFLPADLEQMQPKSFLEDFLPVEVIQRKTLCERKFLLERDFLQGFFYQMNVL